MLREASSGEFGQILALQKNVRPAEYILEPDACTIGRSEMVCQIVVTDSKIVSRVHAKIERQGPRYVLYDANSVNGTFVNGKRIYEGHLLEDGDQIGLGIAKPLLRFNDPDPTIPVSSRLRYDEQTITFSLNRQPLSLSPNQLRLLRHLYQYAGEICTHQSCAEAIWGQNHQEYGQTALHREIGNLRDKLRQIDPQAGDLIETRKAEGYILNP